MNKPMTVSSLLLANAFLCASLCVAQTDSSEPQDQSSMPSQEQGSEPGEPGSPSDPEAEAPQGSQEVEPQAEENPLSDPDHAEGPRLGVQRQDGYLNAEVTLQDEEAGFIVAILVSTSESYMDIRGEAVLRDGKLVAFGLGSGSSFEAPLPAELDNLSVELYLQALILDQDGQLHIGPITRLSELLQESQQQADA